MFISFFTGYNITYLHFPAKSMATTVRWTFSTIFTQSRENLAQAEHQRLLNLALNLASALPADGKPSGFGKEPAEENRSDGLWYKIYSPNAEALLLLKLLLVQNSDVTLEVATLHVDPILIYSPPHGASSLASLFVYAHLWVEDTARFFCLGYMQGSAMERIIQQRSDKWHAVGERTGRLCATDLQQQLDDARVELLKATYEGTPSATTTIPVPFDGCVTDIHHYNFAQDVDLPRLAGSATLGSLFSRLRVENLKATRQVAMQLGDVAALMHLCILPHYGVLGVGNIIQAGGHGYVILYRPPGSLRSALRDSSSVAGRRVMIMQNAPARKVSVWSGDPKPSPHQATYGENVVLMMRNLTLFGL